MEVAYVREAEVERDALLQAERAAMNAAVQKLVANGLRLGHPHSSAVRGTSPSLRELRPRAGRSPWRAFYRRIGDRMVIGAIGPEAKVDPLGFKRAVAAATERLNVVQAKEVL